jgi:hypothetical protein
MRSRQSVFYSTNIEGHRFDGILSADGPYIVCPDGSGVALGVCCLPFFKLEDVTRIFLPKPGWWLVKYDREGRYNLASLSEDGIKTLSCEFGIVVVESDATDPSNQVRAEYFFTSPAWHGLRLWISKHPLKALKWAVHDPYLPGWHHKALLENDSAEWTSLRAPGPLI